MSSLLLEEKKEDITQKKPNHKQQYGQESPKQSVETPAVEGIISKETKNDWKTELKSANIYLSDKQSLLDQSSEKNSQIQRLILALKNAHKTKDPEVELIILDTSYINSIVRESASIKDAITGIHNSFSKKNVTFEIILTRAVYEELINQLNCSKRDEFGRYIMTSQALNELHELIYGGKNGEKPLISLVDKIPSKEIREEMNNILQKRNRKKNSRFGFGDASIIEFISDWYFALGDVGISILSTDSDLKKILRGSSLVRVIKTLRKGRRPGRIKQHEKAIQLAFAEANV